VLLEPALVLLMRVDIIEDDVKLAVREAGNEAVHEAEELDAAAPLRMRCNDPAGGDFTRLGARIDDLEKQGYVFKAAWRGGDYVYTLLYSRHEAKREPPQTKPISQAEPDPQPQQLSLV
jgi:hypothetical protein